MKRNLLTELRSRAYRYIYRPLRRVGSLIIPAESGEPYNFDRAKSYWHSIPRAQGGDPFDSRVLEHVSDEDIVREFDQEMEIARKKEERKVGFALAADSISAIDAPEVMDYGSGIGFYGFEIMARHPGARVTCVDVNEANLAAITRIAKAKGLQDRVSCAVVRDEQARDLNFTRPFDLIVSMGVLHHTPYAPRIVRNLSRFLSGNGIFQVMLYNDAYLRQMEKKAGRRLNEPGFGAMTDPTIGEIHNPYSEAYDDAKAKRLFQGYELVSAHYPNPYYNTYRFRKLPG